MSDTIIGRALWRAVEDADFRRRALRDLGMALAEDGFILTDSEMAFLRAQWEHVQGLNDRAAYERLTALARAHRR